MYCSCKLFYFPPFILSWDNQGLGKVRSWSHHEETRELPGERDNARNNAKGTQARKATHGLDGQDQEVDRTPRGRVSQNARLKNVDQWRFHAGAGRGAQAFQIVARPQI